MASRGSSKDLSVSHELYVALRYDGQRSRSSGAADTDQGDVRTKDALIECKFTGSPAKPLRRKPKLVAQMEKITDEAWSEGRDPAVALRFYWPESPLANNTGWIDLIVRRICDDGG